jgi:hypothetical protein
MFKRIHFVVATIVVYAALVSLFFALIDDRFMNSHAYDSIDLKFCCSSQKCSSKFINETLPKFIKESTGKALEHEIEAHYSRPKCILQPLSDGQTWELVYVRRWRPSYAIRFSFVFEFSRVIWKLMTATYQR